MYQLKLRADYELPCSFKPKLAEHRSSTKQTKKFIMHETFMQQRKNKSENI